ncbi:TPA: hypothetical protein EYP66_12790 [Candidatus Poribacteria bacterium]|nr:hypothetical protein [Candidatus Poribacteria bacterium]
MNEILAEYLYLTRDIDRQTANLRMYLADRLCPPTCYACCVNTATLLFAEVEGLYLKEALEALPVEVRDYVLKKAKRAIRRMENLGYTMEKMVDDAGNKAIDAIKGSPEAECPMLVGGVCVVYKQRPVICRIWGYPMFNGDKVSCCNKTFKGKRDKVKPINYVHYWRETKRLSKELGADEKTPNCYMVVRILEKDDVPIIAKGKSSCQG